jgi:chromosome segregation ATPase
MYLSRIDIQGFKTFAAKTTLHFPRPTPDHKPLTVIVGPNGSGKSNLADAIRWCLGEQSLKHLRGKEAQDIIFSGSSGKARSGFAEVVLTFENTDGALGDVAEMTIARRLYRDGESAYLLNGEETRLQDIQLFLAEAGVGQRSYAVIGQGMIDQIIVASPEDRKQFFDDATGVRGFQMKRHQAVLKLDRASQNLAEVEMLLGELEPRLALLRRQVKKLDERAIVEAHFTHAAMQYYGTLWWKVIDERVKGEGEYGRVKQRVDEMKRKGAEIDEQLSRLEHEHRASQSVHDAKRQESQQAYKRALEELHGARKAHAVAEQEIALARVRAQSSWAPLPLHDIVAEVIAVKEAHDHLVNELEKVQSLDELSALVTKTHDIRERVVMLHKRLVKPAPEAWEPDPLLLAQVADAEEQIVRAESKVKEAEEILNAVQSNSASPNQEVFVLQRAAREAHTELLRAEQELHAREIARARFDAEAEGLLREMRDLLSPELVDRVQRQAPEIREQDISRAHEEVRRLRHQLEVIGSIDPEVVKEHAEVSERYTFLTGQVADLRQAISSTREVVSALDTEIQETAETAFATMNTEFQKYFAVLFGGGTCSLQRVKREKAPAAEGEEQEERASLVPEAAWSGVEIIAAPPGKTQKGLQLLSGGERALTAIALLCAVMATNPSPFVVLDEVDAALDEANTVRFANILAELRQRTQFLVITHNRATMEKADALYGVTMGGDGMSQLLSVKLEDYVQGDSARR